MGQIIGVIIIVWTVVIISEMVKKRMKQEEVKEKKGVKGKGTNKRENAEGKQKPNNNAESTIKKLQPSIGRSTGLQLRRSRSQMRNINKELSQHQEERSSSSQQVPLRTKRKISKQKKSKSTKGNPKGKSSGVKLQRGYKFCQNCQTVLNIHKYVCTECGFVHNMKKHKFDVMKNLSKATPKIVKSIIESNEFNTIGLNEGRWCGFEPSGIFRSQVKEQKGCDIKPQFNNVRQKLKTIAFNSMPILTSDNFSSKVVAQTQQTKVQTRFNKHREQFSIYNSPYPIVCMQNLKLSIVENEKIATRQFLLFTESVQKRQIYQSGGKDWDVLGLSRYEVDNQDEIVGERYQNQKKQRMRQKRLKQEEERQRLMKLRENNAITKKALGLEKYHKVGALYAGETIINIMEVDRIGCGQKIKGQKGEKIQMKSKKQAIVPEQQLRRLSSGRSSGKTKHAGEQEVHAHETEELRAGHLHSQKTASEHAVLRIGVRQHVEMVKSLKNKLAILTGRKTVLLMNVDLDWVKGSIIKYENESVSRDDDILWLSDGDFTHQSVEENDGLGLGQNGHNYQHEGNKDGCKRHLSEICLYRGNRPSQTLSLSDQFTVMEWLRLCDNQPGHQLHQDHPSTWTTSSESYLITGTLHGHIIIYKISPQNKFSIYRTIVGAHFEMVSCLSECPLNANGGVGMFASASYDGSVKVWEREQVREIAEFEVSNRKVQLIHWDSGAKFLLVVRDEGLENCYLACFYSVTNRVQLPMMLSDSIDFRLIRNGLLFDNSCSPLIGFPLNSRLILMLNNRNGFLKIMQTQQLRKTSLKRKKSKKSYQQEVYGDYWVRMAGKEVQVVKMKGNCNGEYAALGYGAKVVEQEREGGVQMRIDDGEMVDVDVDSDDGQEQEEMIEQHRQQQKTGQKLLPRPQKQPPTTPQPLRKSLRTRKPVIQYNFMQEEQEELDSDDEVQSYQNSRKSKRHNMGRKKKREESEDEEFCQEEEDESDGGMEEQVGRERMVRVGEDKQRVKGNRVRGNNSSSHKKPQPRKGLRVRHQPKLQTVDYDKPSIEEQLYKLFWQQTSEQSLVMQKQHYPLNKFPKFSAMVSFLTVGDSSTCRKDDVDGQGEVEDQQKSKGKNRLDIGRRKTGVKQTAGLQKEPEDQQCEYLTSFIAGYNGELIRVRVKVDGCQQQEGDRLKQQDQNSGEDISD